MLCSTTGLGMS